MSDRDVLESIAKKVGEIQEIGRQVEARQKLILERIATMREEIEEAKRAVSEDGS